MLFAQQTDTDISRTTIKQYKPFVVYVTILYLLVSFQSLSRTRNTYLTYEGNI